MRGLLISCISVLSAVAMSAPAIADEAPAKPKRERAAAPQRAAPTQQQGANWSGGQVGGSNGVSSVNNNFVDPGAFVCPEESTFGRNCFETPFQFSGHKTVYTIGPFIGYRWQLGNWVVGLEGDWSWKNAETSLSQSSSVRIVDNFGDASLRTDQFSGSIKQKSDYSIRGRVGTLVTPWSLLYATGGVAFSEISGSFAYKGTLCEGLASSPCTPSLATATATTAFTWNDTRTGYTVGAGWESELFRGWKWRAEYRWTDFGNYTKTFGLPPAAQAPSSPASDCTSSPSSSWGIERRNHLQVQAHHDFPR
jgi:opacity protein-like surface antigen